MKNPCKSQIPLPPSKKPGPLLNTVYSPYCSVLTASLGVAAPSPLLHQSQLSIVRMDQSQVSIVTVDQSQVSISAPGLGRHPDVVEGVGVEVLQEVGGGVRVLDGLVVGELLQRQGRGEIMSSAVFTCILELWKRTLC